MKEPYSEGIAHHTGPESWGGSREAAVQALTGEDTSPVLSREILKLGDADDVLWFGRQQRDSQYCVRLSVSPAVRDLARVWKPSTRNPGEPVVLQAGGCLERIGKPQGARR